MTLKPQEKIKIDNYKSQYNSILENIKVANTELEKSFETTKQTKKEHDLLSLEKEQVRSEIKGIVNYKNDTFKDIQNELSKLKKKEKDLEERQIKIEEKELKINKELKEEEDKYSAIFRILKEKTKRENDKLIKVDTEYADLIILTKDKNKELIQLNKDIRNANDLIASLKIRFELDTEKKEKINKELEKELKNLKQQIEKEQNKVGKASENILIREKQLMRKERDIQTTINRIRRKYKELYPNLELKI